MFALFNFSLLSNFEDCRNFSLIIDIQAPVSTKPFVLIPSISVSHTVEALLRGVTVDALERADTSGPVPAFTENPKRAYRAPSPWGIPDLFRGDLPEENLVYCFSFPFHIP